MISSHLGQPNCKKVYSNQECCSEKDAKSKVAANNDCDGRLMAKNCIAFSTIRHQIHLNCHYSHLLFITAFLRVAHFFIVGLFWIRFHFFL